MTAAVSGAAWIDFTVADKGMAIEAVARRLGIGKDEMMAFGDNFNDVEMLEAVGRPCLMETADPALLERFPSAARAWRRRWRHFWRRFPEARPGKKYQPRGRRFD